MVVMTFNYIMSFTMIVSYCFTSEVQFFETKSEMSETGNPGTPEFDLATAENRMRQPQSDP